MQDLWQLHYQVLLIISRKKFTKLKLKFIDSARFMATSLSSLVDNLTEGIHKAKFTDCDCFLEYEVSKKIQ